MKRSAQLQLDSRIADFDGQNNQLAEAYLYQVARVMALPQVNIVKFLLGLVIGKAAHRLAQLSIELDQKEKQGGPAVGVQAGCYPTLSPITKLRGRKRFRKKGP